MKPYQASFQTLTLPGTQTRAVWLSPEDFETAERLLDAYNRQSGGHLSLPDYIGALIQARAQRQEGRE